MRAFTYSAFSCCNCLRTVALPEGVESVCEWAFAESALEEMRIPASMAEIGRFAFADCAELASMSFA